MTKKEIRKTPSITMAYFLKTYLGVTNTILLNKLTELSHCELKEVAKIYGVKLSKISFDTLTKDMIARGDILLVEDNFGNKAPYINPLRKMENEYETTLDERYVSHELYDLEGEDNNDQYKGKQKVKYIKP